MDLSIFLSENEYVDFSSSIISSKVDARGNTKGKNAQFSLTEPQLAFHNRSQYDEYFWDGIYAKPHLDTMLMLDKADSLQDVMDNIPDYVLEKPDPII